jgi:anthranilate phosphoribosyltransferase
MATRVTIKILKLDVENRVCVAEISDNNSIIITGNVGLDNLNPDGTANNLWIINRVKDYVIDYRNSTAKEHSLEVLKTTINSQGV